MTQEPTSNPIRVVNRGPGSLITGVTYPFRALWLFITTPTLRGYLLTPILINVLLGITVYAGLLVGGFKLIDTVIASIPTWTAEVPHWAVHLPDWTVPLPDWLPRLPHWTVSLPSWMHLPDWHPHLPDWVADLPTWGAMLLVGLLRLLLTLVLLLLTGFIFLQFGVLLGAPWYGKLSEELEKMRTGQLTLVEVGAVTEIWRAVLYELKKLVLWLGIGMPLLLLGLLPGPGTLVGTIGSITIAATVVCLDFFDSPLERRRLHFRQKLRVVWSSLPASASFALVCLGLVSIPFVNLLAIPVCVAAGTLFVCDRILPKLQLPQNLSQK
jgi:CysZ protein